MSWFRSSKPAEKPQEKTDTYDRIDDQTYQHADFDNTKNDAASLNAYSGSVPNRNVLNQAAVEALVQQEQERQTQTQYLAKLAEIAFDKCITKPDSELHSSDVDCLTNVMHKYVDAQKLIVGRYLRQQQSKTSLN